MSVKKSTSFKSKKINMKKTIFTVLSILFIANFVKAQETKLLVRGSFSIGTEYQDLNYAGSTIFYSLVVVVE
jgi:hypothetical protein